MIQDIFSKNQDTELLFYFLRILFNKLPNNFNESPIYTLWLLALTNLPNDIFLSKYHDELKKFYKFFVLKNNYSPSIHLLPEKITELFEEFKEIINQYRKISWLKSIYLHLIRRNPAKIPDYAKQMQVENIPLDINVYNLLISYAKSFEIAKKIFEEMQSTGLKISSRICNILLHKGNQKQAIELFEEMQTKGLTPNEISYNTLINKAPYDKAIILFEQMQTKGLKIGVITFNTILKKSVQLQKILDLLDQMIQLKIKPQENYTVLAVQKKLKKSQTPYKIWVEEKQEELKDAPFELYIAWEEFFQQTTK